MFPGRCLGILAHEDEDCVYPSTCGPDNFIHSDVRHPHAPCKYCIPGTFVRSRLGHRGRNGGLRSRYSTSGAVYSGRIESDGQGMETLC